MAEGRDKKGDSLSHRGGTIPGTRKPAYTLSVPDGLPTPVILAVPHAGRSYPEELWKRMRKPEWSALRLEDRYVDRIATEVARQTGAALMVAHAPRAMIDLNRASDDIDWSMVRGEGGQPGAAARPAPDSRARSGLGLVPRRLPGHGEIWKAPITGADLDARVSQVHRPYHRALAEGLEALRETWGAALLIDLHSMPPIHSAFAGDKPPRYVIGDRFGASCEDSIVEEALRTLAGLGEPVAHNRPYEGGYVLDQHGDPARGLHAIQIELCRSSYLDRDMAELKPDYMRVADMLAQLVGKLAVRVAALGRDDRPALAAE